MERVCVRPTRESARSQPACLLLPQIIHHGWTMPVFLRPSLYNTAPPSLAQDLALRRRIICAPINIKLHQPVRVIAALAYFFILRRDFSSSSWVNEEARSRRNEILVFSVGELGYKLVSSTRSLMCYIIFSIPETRNKMKLLMLTAWLWQWVLLLLLWLGVIMKSKRFHGESK